MFETPLLSSRNFSSSSITTPKTEINIPLKIPKYNQNSKASLKIANLFINFIN